MVRTWMWLGLSLALSSTALAESAVPSGQVSVPAEIPSNGVLPMFGICLDPGCSNLTAAVVTDSSTGTVVDGHIELVMTRSYEGWAYFTPTSSFRSGTSYQVTTVSTYPGAAYPSWVRAVEPTALTESALSVQPTAYVVSEVKDRRCCSTCIDVTVQNTLEASVAMSISLPIATQYLFALSLHDEGKTGVFGDFAPLRSDRAMLPRVAAFDGTSSRPCYTVQARPIVGGETVKLTTSCIDISKFTDLGTHTLSDEEIAKWSASCEEVVTPAPPPPPRSDAGAQPSAALPDASTDADGEPLGRGEEEKITREKSGCQLASKRIDASGMTWLLALLALRLARRRSA